MAKRIVSVLVLVGSLAFAVTGWLGSREESETEPADPVVVIEASPDDTPEEEEIASPKAASVWNVPEQVDELELRVALSNAAAKSDAEWTTVVRDRASPGLLVRGVAAGELSVLCAFLATIETDPRLFLVESVQVARNKTGRLEAAVAVRWMPLPKPEPDAEDAQ